MAHASFSDISPGIIALKISTIVQFMLYGVYAVLFGISIHVLNRKQERYRYHLSALTFLFLLSSADVALFTMRDILYWCNSCSQPNIGLPQLNDIMAAANAISLLSSAVADGILLWRCYMLWRRWKVIALPLFIFAGGHGFGLALAPNGYSISPLTLTFLTISIGLNSLLLSMLIAFRIFKISREVMNYLGPNARNMYAVVLAATIECGLLYSSLLIILLSLAISLIQRGGVVTDEDPDTRIQGIMICVRALAPIAGINSTMIIVRIALGISLNDVESTIKSLGASGPFDETVAHHLPTRLHHFSRREQSETIASENSC